MLRPHDCPDGGIEPYQPPLDDTYDENGARRYGCEFAPGDGVTAQVTVGPALPPIPLSHVIVLMMENRSFDHYFGALASLRPAVDGTVASSNPDPTTKLPVSQYHLLDSVTLNSPDHEWGPSHLQYDNGRMDGFVMASYPDGGRTMGYYDCRDIPFYYWLANTFAMSERHFASLLGPTWPNRLFFVAATSCGLAEGSETNDRLTSECGHVQGNMFKQLDAAHVGYKVYDGGIPSVASLFLLTGALTDAGAFGDIGDFETAVATDALPAVSVIEPHYQAEVDILGPTLDGQANDDHPPADIRLGQRFVYRIVKALASNVAVWSSSALFITYDENGGFYDHVPPPQACDPAGANAPYSDYHFDRYGFRVPLLLVSAHARAGYISQRVTDHTSILRFIQAWKGLPALTWRDANAWPMLDMFDFQSPPAPPPDLSSRDPQSFVGMETLCGSPDGGAQ